MAIILFFICFIATTIGAITGIGGGIIIKPVLDSTGIMTVSSISFLSACTVLSMAIVSLLKNTKSKIKIDTKKTTFLAIGSAAGGILGKYIFDIIKTGWDNDGLLAIMQSGILCLLTIGVFVYILCKDKIKTMVVGNIAICVSSGLILGVISSFLGIGGGPINLVVLYILFSMDTKTAALNSIYIILFSQVFSIMFTVITGNIPGFPVYALVAMIAGGVGGGFAGSEIMKRISIKGVNKVFMGLLGIIIFICIFNILKFTI